MKSNLVIQIRQNDSLTQVSASLEFPTSWSLNDVYTMKIMLYMFNTLSGLLQYKIFGTAGY